MPNRANRVFAISLRYKLALPVAIFVFLMLLLLTHNMISLVRDLVLESFQSQIIAQAQALAEDTRDLLFKRDPSALRTYVNQFASRYGIFGVRVRDTKGSAYLEWPGDRELPVIKERLEGTRVFAPQEPLVSVILNLDSDRLTTSAGYLPKLHMVSAPIEVGTREVGRVELFYTSELVNETIRKIYQKRILFSFLGALAIAFLTSGLTWVAIRPLFRLQKTVQDILGGQMDARAKIHTGDEIEDLAEAFNEMVGRLQHSLKNLQTRSEALQESEEKYRALVENANDVIWMLSPEGKILFMNQSFPGLSRETLLKEGFPLLLSFHTEEAITQLENALKEVKIKKIAVSLVPTVYRNPQTRTEIFYSTNLTPVLNPAGELKAIQAVTRDITELKRIEMMKERLIRDVAHELRTPVAKFQMTLDWLEKELSQGDSGSRHQELLGVMKRNVALLMSMIGEVMDLSRLESGAERLERRPCELNRILLRVCEDLEPLIREKKLALERRFCAPPLLFAGDDRMLYRLFSNLVSNALKFTEQGKIIVESEKAADWIRIVVRDTGIGLEKDDLNKVFDRFFQKTAATPGMGLGLALSREIVLLHGGKIWTESEGLGKGAAFWIEFPQ